MKMPSFLIWILGIFPVLLMGAGCGGAGSNPVPGPVIPTVTIEWPARPRGVVAPMTALSATVVFLNASADGQDVAVTVDRQSPSAAYRQACQPATAVLTGDHSLHVDFHAQPGGAGSVVAAADARVNVQASGEISGPDHRPLGEITYASAVAKVWLPALQAIPLNQPTHLTATAINKSGQILAIADGAATFAVIKRSGSAIVNADQTVTGIAVGSIDVTATIDGVASEATEESVNYPTLSATVDHLTIANHAIVSNPVTHSVWVSVDSSDPVYGNEVIEIDPGSRRVMREIPAGSEPGPLAISDDGSVLFVALQGASNIRRISLAGSGDDYAISLPQSAFSQHPGVSDMKVLPGLPDRLLVSLRDAFSSAGQAMMIFDHGVALPHTVPAFAEGGALAVASPTLAWSRGFENAIVPLTLDQDGVTTPTVSTLSDNYSALAVVGPHVFSADGCEWDATTGRFISQYPVTGYSFLADANRNRILYASAPNGQVLITVIELISGKLLTQALIPQYSTYGLDNQTRSPLIPYGSSGIMLRTPYQLLFVDQFPSLTATPAR